ASVWPDGPDSQAARNGSKRFMAAILICGPPTFRNCWKICGSSVSTVATSSTTQPVSTLPFDTHCSKLLAPSSTVTKAIELWLARMNDVEADGERPLSAAAPSTRAVSVSITARGDPSRALVSCPAMSEGPWYRRDEAGVWALPADMGDTGARGR